MARKLLLNSLYGALGNAYFRWYDLAFAEAITLTGQLVIKWVEKDVNSYLNGEFKTIGEDYVIAMDTDSLYLDLGKLKPTGSITEVIDFVNEYSETHIVPKIDESLNALYQYTHGHTPFLTMKREAIASTGIFVAKKRYMLNVYDNEGVRYSEPNLKIMGVEAVKSSTPEVCREKLKQAITILMNGSESDVIKFIDDFRKQFNKLPVEDISFPRSCNGMDTYANSTTIFGSKTPIQVRGGLVYNHYLKQLDLDEKYEIINNGDKVKYCYLKLPNPVRQNVISYVNRLPEELNLEKYIDYNTQF
jgi:DNA polymerase elongation subunit (family B)